MKRTKRRVVYDITVASSRRPADGLYWEAQNPTHIDTCLREGLAEATGVFPWDGIAITIKRTGAP